ncbi:MAG: hypothetical protein J3K34DRAFT_521647 [Monoraphidium minutum]|nr:MAG: hypothetical protein J3K34DRAFT_521647 [Monoraphidium minutum]
MADPAAPPAPTFNWIGNGATDAETGCIYFEAFQFCNTRYSTGDHVFLLPEDEGAPLYIARILRAFEDPRAPEPDRLCIEASAACVRWYERKTNMPAAFQENMHDRELVESLQSDTNLVGCIDHRAVVVHGASYEEALARVPPGDLEGEWYFCRGVLDAEGAAFRTYEELAASAAAAPPLLPYGGEWGLAPSLLATTSGGGGDDGDGGSQQHAGGGGRRKRSAAAHANGVADMGGIDLFQRPQAARQPGGRAKGGGGGGAKARPAGGGGGGGGGARGVPGKVCFECGATQTPQWREGPVGPKTLCNACGVRYQRSQGKGINKPKRERAAAAAGRGGGGGGRSASPPARPTKVARGPGGARTSARANKGQRARGRGGTFGDDDDEDYNPAWERGGYVPQYGQYHDHPGGSGEGEEETGGDEEEEDAGPGGGGGGAPRLHRTQTAEAADALAGLAMSGLAGGDGDEPPSGCGDDAGTGGGGGRRPGTPSSSLARGGAAAAAHGRSPRHPPLGRGRAGSAAGAGEGLMMLKRETPAASPLMCGLSAGGLLEGMPGLALPGLLLGHPDSGGGPGDDLGGFGMSPARGPAAAPPPQPLAPLPLAAAPAATPPLGPLSLAGLSGAAARAAALGLAPGLEPLAPLLRAAPPGAAEALPPGAAAALGGAQRALEGAINEVKAADAAVVAVGKVLEQKGAAAAAAHARVRAAGAQLRALIEAAGAAAAPAGAEAPGGGGGGGAAGEPPAPAGAPAGAGAQQPPAPQAPSPQQQPGEPPHGRPASASPPSAARPAALIPV